MTEMFEKVVIIGTLESLVEGRAHIAFQIEGKEEVHYGSLPAENLTRHGINEKSSFRIELKYEMKVSPYASPVDRETVNDALRLAAEAWDKAARAEKHAEKG